MHTCALCGSSVPVLAESHVYPKALHLLFADTDDEIPPFTIHRTAVHPGQAVQRIRGGVYGQFVCPRCENERFGPADNAFMALHHRLSSWPLPDGQMEMVEQLVPGDPDLMHRFALQTLWRWDACRRDHFEQMDAVGFGPVIERIRSWLMKPAGTLWTGLDVAVSYRIAKDEGLVVPPFGGWRAGSIIMTVGKFTLFVASRTRGLRAPLRDHRLSDEGGVRVLATTNMQDWIVEPVADMLSMGRMAQADALLERMRSHSKAKKEKAQR